MGVSKRDIPAVPAPPAAVAAGVWPEAMSAGGVKAGDEITLDDVKAANLEASLRRSLFHGGHVTAAEVEEGENQARTLSHVFEVAQETAEQCAPPNVQACGPGQLALAMRESHDSADQQQKQQSQQLLLANIAQLNTAVVTHMSASFMRMINVHVSRMGDTIVPVPNSQGQYPGPDMVFPANLYALVKLEEQHIDALLDHHGMSSLPVLSVDTRRRLLAQCLGVNYRILPR